MAADTSNAAASTASLALKLGSAAVDAMVLMADLGEELPVIKPVLKTLKAIRETTENVQSNREELVALQQRCAYITACLITRRRLNASSEMDVTPVVDCTEAVRSFGARCSRRHKLSRVLKASSDKVEIAALNARINRAMVDVCLAGIATLEGKADDTRVMLETMIHRCPRPAAKLAKVPKGTPARKSWHVERAHVIEAVVEALDGGRRVVGLVGNGGSGKTTAASEVVKTKDVRQTFADGIVWLPVNRGAEGRLPSLMLHLARMVYEDIGGSLGREPSSSDDGAAYVKQQVENGHGGKGLTCLVVADNVWEKEVVSALHKTGVCVLLSTRDEEVLRGVPGKIVGVDQLSKEDADSMLKKAAELPAASRLPDAAIDIIELCDHVAMDLAFVGRWSTLRGREDNRAWSGAASQIRREIDEGLGNPDDCIAEDVRCTRRKAILQAGFNNLAVGTDDERVPRLYLSLAILPDGHAFTAKDAAVLLYDGSCTAEDEVAARGVAEVLERWTIIRSAGVTYHMHDAHCKFARDRLKKRGDIRDEALGGWIKYLSTLESVRSIDTHILKGLWQAVESVGGDGWSTSRPYAKALEGIDESDLVLFRTTLQAVAWFQDVQGELEEASTTWRRLLETEKMCVGTNHPFVLGIFMRLAGCAERLGNAETAAEWRERARKGLPLARAKFRVDADADEGEDLDDCLLIVATGIITLAPEDRPTAEVLLRRSLEIQEGALIQNPSKLWTTLLSLGTCARDGGRPGEAVELFTRCLSIQEALLGPNHLQVAVMLLFLGASIRQAGRLGEAEELLTRSLSILEVELGPGHAGLACTLQDLGLCVRNSGRLGEAEKLFRRCLTIREESLGPNHYLVACTLHQLGVCIGNTGRLRGAEELLRRCLSILEAKLGPTHVEVAFALHDLGICIRQAGRLGEAEELLRRCLSIREASLGPNGDQVGETLFLLALCVRQLGRPREGEELLRRCLSVNEAALGLTHANVAHTLRELGLWARRDGRLGEAEELLRRCLSILEAKLGPTHVDLACTLHDLGICIRQAGRLREAEELLRRCLSIRESGLGSTHWYVAHTLYDIDLCIRYAGYLREAKQTETSLKVGSRR